MKHKQQLKQLRIQSEADMALLYCAVAIKLQIFFYIRFGF